MREGSGEEGRERCKRGEEGEKEKEGRMGEEEKKKKGRRCSLE